jgi:Protein of unknown function (DUF3489)
MATKTKTTTKAPRIRKGVATTRTKPTQNAEGETKRDLVIRLLRRQDGASLPELAKATNWMPHSVRGFLTATVRKKLALPLVSTKAEGAERRYHIAALKPAKE